MGSAAGAELGQDGASSAPLCSAPAWGVNPPVSFLGTDCLVPARVRGTEVEVPHTQQVRRELDKKRLGLALKKKKRKKERIFQVNGPPPVPRKTATTPQPLAASRKKLKTGRLKLN